jgi:hypothetical protein
MSDHECKLCGKRGHFAKDCKAPVPARAAPKAPEQGKAQAKWTSRRFYRANCHMTKKAHSHTSPQLRKYVERGPQTARA